MGGTVAPISWPRASRGGGHNIMSGTLPATRSGEGVTFRDKWVSGTLDDAL